MKSKNSTLPTLIAGALCALFTATAWANHRSGDRPLPENMTSGDFNDDGNTDLAIDLSGFDNFAVLQGDGAGNFTLSRHIEEDTLPKDIASGDVDGDGLPDILSIAEWGYNIRVYLGDRKGDFQFVNEFPGDGEPNRLVLADLNKDGKLDVVANAPAEGVVLVYFGLGGGRFSNTALELEDYPNIFGIATGDFNEDSNLDIAITYFENKTETGSHLQILLGDGAGNFSVGANVLTNPQANNVHAFDLNHDGHLDLIIAGAGSENVAGLFLSSFLGDGAGNFTESQVIDLGLGSIKGKLGIADFNRDGNVDVAFPRSTGGSDLLIFLGDGDGNFTQGQTVIVGKEPGSALSGDFNKDGKNDLAVTNRTDATLSILLGNGDATFATHATIPLNVPTP